MASATTNLNQKKSARKNVIVSRSNEIVPTLDSEDVDLALYDHVTLDVRTIGGEAYADA